MKQASFAVAAVILALSGCATTGPDGQQAPMMSDASMAKMKSTGIGAGVGCVAGAVMASMTGGKPAVGCAIGAAGGAAIGFVKAREEELAEMRLAQAELPGAQLETRPVQVTEKATGKVEKVDAFSTLAVPMSPASVANPSGAKVLNRMGTLAAKQNSIVTISGGGTQAQRDQAAMMLYQGGAKQVIFDPKVKTSVGKKGDLVVTLSPANAASQVEV